MKYKLSDFDFNLSEDLIATHPAEPRDSSRLLVLDKKTGKIEHKHFFDIIDYLNPGDILVLNNSKVIPARLWAKKKETGGKVEVLLHKKLSADTWQCLLGGKVHEGLILSFRSAPGGEESLKDEKISKGSLGSADAPLGMTAVVLKNNHDGTWDLKFNKSGAALMKAVEKIGEVPLPPYIVNQRKKTLSFRAAPGGEEPLGGVKNAKRSFDSADAPLRMTKMNDKSDYQTVFADAKKTGSVAAPTAGLHFTPELLQMIKKKGVKILEITLYVGMGTFAPVKTEDITQHLMHSEWVEISGKVIAEIEKNKSSFAKASEDEGKRKKSGRIIAVGTTSARSLEACWNNFVLAKNVTHPQLRPAPSRGAGLRWAKPSRSERATPCPAEASAKAGLSRGDYKAWVDIFIYPGYKFKIVDAMITNFHLPKSTLLMLVSALAGKKNIDRAYREAIKKKYRFYSYGDAMFIK